MKLIKSMLNEDVKRYVIEEGKVVPKKAKLIARTRSKW